MLDFLRDTGRSAEEKRYEAISAYVDDALTAAERARFEADMASNPTLRAEVERLQIVKAQLRAAAHRRVPRSYSLDPAMFGAPKAQPAMQLYPVLRGATALTALVFAIVLGLGLLNGGFGGGSAPAMTAQMVEEQTAPDEEIAMEAAAVEEAAPAFEEAAAPSADAAVQSFESDPTLSAEGTTAPEGTMAAALDAPAAEMAAAGIVEATPSAELREIPTEVAGITESFGVEPAPALESTAGEALPADTTNAAGDAVPVAQATTQPWLLPLAIGLGIALLALLLLTLWVRRRMPY